ncbi:unnamed protein product [Lymnaea stagnalis]|uniref:OTU domain-containing protein n=1 Tax=Lymnaea stagnalis TaxID=6523 RepID=A0AAV2HRY4_LYMST
MSHRDTRYCIANSGNSLDEPIYLPVSNYWQKKHSRLLGLTFVRYLNIKTPSRQLHLRNYVPASIHATHGDGNCLFRCFSLAITGSDAFHETLREIIANHIMRNGKAFSVLFHERFQDNPNNYLYQTRMAQRGTWGSDVEIMAAAHLLKTKIFVYTIHGDTWQWVEHNLDLTSPASRVHRQSIYLMHTSLVHYDLVKEIKIRRQITWDRSPSPENDQNLCRYTVARRPQYMPPDRRYKCQITKSASRNKECYRCNKCTPRSEERENSVVKCSTMHKDCTVQKARYRCKCKLGKMTDRSRSRSRKRKSKSSRKSLKRKLV